MEKTFVNNFFKVLKGIESEDDALDFIYDSVEDKLVGGNFEVINSLCSSEDISSTGVQNLVGLLVITSPWKDRLSGRSNVFSIAYDLICKLYPEHERDVIIKGLE